MRYGRDIRLEPGGLCLRSLAVIVSLGKDIGKCVGLMAWDDMTFWLSHSFSFPPSFLISLFKFGPAAYTLPLSIYPTSPASMFNGSSNIIIQGETFIVINGDIYQADGVSRSTVGVENNNCRRLDPIFRICHVPDTEPFSHRFPSWQADAQDYTEPETYPTVECDATMSFDTPVHASGQFLEHGPCLMPPTISSEGSLWDEITSTPTPVMSVNASKGNVTPNKLHPFPMPDYSSKPLHATHARHCTTFPEPEHFLGAAHPASSFSHHPIRASA